MKQFLLWTWVLLWTPFTLVGQACGCLDCPATVPVYFNSFQLAYQVGGAVNDELSTAQCVESVQVQFSHNRIQNLGLELISPTGQVVTLVGTYMPFGGGLAGTVGAKWNVNFTPCGTAASPDPGLTPFWDNLHPAWSVFFGNFTGTYYPPFGNCLENFNTGSVNGNWQLRVTNYDFPPVTGPGIIEDFTIKFCDETGINCCFPEGGTLQDDMPLTACEGDAELQLDIPTPIFNNVFDDTQYGYTFLLVRNDSIIGISNDFQLQDSIAGDYSIQGLSYALADNAIIPTFLGEQINVLNNLLSMPSPPFCGALSSNLRVIQILPRPETLFRTETICAGESLLIAGQNFDETGDYDILLPAATCDTLLQLQLNVLTADTMRVDTTLCIGEVLQIATQIFDQTGSYEVVLQNVAGCDSLIQVELFVQALEVDIAMPPSLTCRDENVNLLATASGSTDLAYEWRLNDNTIGTTNNITVNEAGIYELKVLDENTSCTTDASIEVQDERSFPMAEAGEDVNLTCRQTNVELEGISGSMGNLEYTWQLPDGSSITEAIVIAADTGFYFLTVENIDNACRTRDSVYVGSQQNLPMIEAGEDAVLTCIQPSIRLNNLAFAEDGVEYLWASPDGRFVGDVNSISTSVDAAGIYYLTAENTLTGCLAQDSVRITDNAMRPLADAGMDTSLTCSRRELSLDASNSSAGGTIIYNWTSENGMIVSGGNSLSPVINTAGTYILNVEDTSNACISQDSVLVIEDAQAPLLELPTEITLLCNQNTFTPELGIAENDVNYTWRDIDGIEITTVFEPPLFLGAYTLEAVNTRNDCSATANIQITQVPLPELQVSSTNIAEDCLEFNFNIAATSNTATLQYTWQDTAGNTLATSPNFEVQTPGTYYVQAYNAQTRCTAIDSIQLDESTELSIETASLAVQQLDCLDNPLGSIAITSVVGGQAPFVYALNTAPFSTRSSFDNLEAATYQVLIQDAQGCEWDSLITIPALEQLQIELGADQEIKFGQSIDLELLANENLMDVSWSSSHKDTFACPDCLVQNLMPLQSTIYSVSATDENGCTASDKVNIIVSREVPIYIPTAFSPNDDGQNDFFEIFPLASAVTAIEELKVFNRWGELVFEQLESTDAWDGRFQGRALPTDTYIVIAKVQYIDGKTEMLSGEVTLIR